METILEQWFAISQDDLDVALLCIANIHPKNSLLRVIIVNKARKKH
jgi:hypothetical protein